MIPITAGYNHEQGSSAQRNVAGQRTSAEVTLAVGQQFCSFVLL